MGKAMSWERSTLIPPCGSAGLLGTGWNGHIQTSSLQTAAASVTCGIVQHSAALGIGEVHICAGRQQRLDAGDAVEADRDAQRGDAAAVLGVHVAPGLLQQPCQRACVANLGRVVQRAGRTLRAPTPQPSSLARNAAVTGSFDTMNMGPPHPS